MKTINNWKPETRSLIETLVANDFKVVRGSNGEDSFSFQPPVDKFIENLVACDEAWLYVKHPSHAEKIFTLYLVLGNSPGELVCDYSVCPELDQATETHFNNWNGKPQPKTTI